MDSSSGKSLYLRSKALLLLALALVVLWSAVGWNRHDNETQGLEGIRRQTAALALLFARHTTDTFQGVDHALMELRDSWVTRPSELAQQISHYRDYLGGVVLQVAIIDAQGMLVFSSLGLSTTPVSLADREHFKVHQGTSHDKLFVSRPVRGRVSGKWSIQLTRPIFDKAQFVGVIVMSVDPHYFVNFYEAADMGKDGVAKMVRDTGEIMVHSGATEKYLGAVIRTASFAAPGLPLQGSFQRLFQDDGVERLASYVHLPQYGLSVIIGPSVDEWMAPSRDRQRLLLLAAGVVTLLAMMMTWLLVRSMLHKAAVMDALAESRLGLRASHDLFETLSTHVPGMIYQYRLYPDGRSNCPYVSEGVLDLYEVTPAQAIAGAAALFANVHEDDLDKVKATIDESARTLQPWHHEFRVNLPKRGLRWLIGHSQPVRLAEGSVLWHGYMTDITETKNVEATLRTVNEELEAFSYSVSHDLRSPLNTIDGFSVLLAKKLSGSDNAKALHYLSRIRVSTAQMAQLIADLLSLAQIARTKIAYQPVDLSALAGLVVLDLQAGRPEQQVVVHVDSGLGLWGDAGLLRVVLQNLLGNAWKYSSKRTDAVISVGRTLNAAGRTVFFVKDNGAGFDMAHAEKLFQPFQRLHEEAEFTGTGIGLATVSRIIVRHGGRIWAESAPGAGATFFFTLPAGPAEV
ncbi:MAG: ATP-binding protein [Burkholderiaceae bacterium]|nr:ATP-binding protein [Burkholderiaceae bacterium]